MSEEKANGCRHFLSYSGMKLPLNLVNPLAPDEVGNRNTYYRAYYDGRGRLASCQKVVYGEVESEHRYCYYDSGMIKQAQIIEGEDVNTLLFDEDG